jgi:hypothetical protein
MKKIYITAICLVILFAGKAQFVVTGGDTIAVAGTTNPTYPIVSSGSCRNTGADTITLTWQILSDSTVPGWTYTGFCDNNNCYNFYIGAERSFTLTPGASGILEIHLTQGCVQGAGNVKVLLWNSADSASTVQLITFAVNITAGTGCPAGIEENEAQQFMLSPDPVKDQLKITLAQNTGAGQIDIYNLFGSKVASQPVGSDETIKYFDLRQLEAGFYVTVITRGGKLIATRKFARVD